MGHHNFRLLLQRRLILLLEFLILRFREKLATCREEVHYVRGASRFISIAHLVDLHHQSRNHSQPGELLVVYDKLQEFTSVYPTVRSLETFPLHFEKGSVEVQ
jgi:hypothetical protein